MSFLLQRRLRAFLRTTTVLAGSAPTVLAGAVPTILAGAAPAVAQTTSASAAASAPVNIGGVQSTAAGAPQGGAGIAPVPTTATQFAPSYTPLTAIQPTSVVDSGTLQKLAPQTDDYNDIVNLTPSTTDISPAGPGLQQDFGQSIRGLQYTEFSVLWDGIPVPGFPFNFAPQPGAYFLGRDFASVTVNRGPGQASAIGDATFGGSVDLAAENPIATPQVETYGTFGSFGTKFFGIQGNTGAISQTGGTEGVLGPHPRGGARRRHRHRHRTPQPLRQDRAADRRRDDRHLRDQTPTTTLPRRLTAPPSRASTPTDATTT